MTAERPRALGGDGPAAGACARRAAEKAGLIELTGELVERAQATGAMRADFSADDIPSMMCGLARATAPRGARRRAMSWERYLEIIIAGLRARRPAAAPPACR